MTILWREEMSVSHHDIDNDHKYLICLINTIEASVNCGLGKKVLLGHLSELLIYTEEHFKREEKIQADVKYPYCDIHKGKHDDLKKRLIAIRANLEHPPKAEYYHSAVQSLFDTLKDWLLTHILDEDLKMKSYFVKK